MGRRADDTRWWLLVMLMPFFYACATRLPFIAYAIEAFRFGFSPVEVGALIANYQFTRAIGNSLQGRLSHLPWCIIAYLIGFAGYAANIGYASVARGRVQFCIGFGVAGFTEVLPCLTTWLKEAYAEEDQSVQRRWYRMQYTVINMGSAFCFAVGGVLYDKVGIHGVAYFGAASALLGLISTIAFSAVMVRGSSDTTVDDAPGGDASLVPSQEATWRGMTWIEYVLGLSFGIESTTIAIVLSVGPLFLLDHFGMEPLRFGFLMAGGELLGGVLLLMTVDERLHELWRWCLPNPWPLVVGFGILTIANLLYLVPKTAGGIAFVCIGQVLIHGVNGFVVGILIEMQGSTTAESDMKHIASFGQTCRRILNCTFSFLAPILYDAIPRAPFICAACVSFVWTVFLAFAMYADMQQKRKLLESDPGDAARRACRGTWITMTLEAGKVSGASRSRDPASSPSRSIAKGGEGKTSGAQYGTM